MEPARYALQQGWDNNSALEEYGAVHEPNFRVGGSYDDRRFIDERFCRDTIYPRDDLHRDVLERDPYPPLPPHSIGLWPQARRRSYEEEYSSGRESRRHEKPYLDSYRDMDTIHDVDKFHDANALLEFDDFQDNYHSVDQYRDPGFDRPSRSGGRDRDENAFTDYDSRHRGFHQHREDSRRKNYDHGRHSYDSDYDRDSRRDGHWRRHESHVSEREKRLSRERDHSPSRRYERSLSRGYDDRTRSRSPRSRSLGRCHREDSYDDGRYEKMEKRRDREERRYHEHYSAAPSATVVVKGLSQKTTEEDLYRILAQWGPLSHVRVIKERSSGISRGFAFIDFPSSGAARELMDIVVDDGLLVDGRKIFFEYSSKPTGGASGYYTLDNSAKSISVNNKSITVASDWMCTICGCINFARRMSCFQCNEGRTDDSPPADLGSLNQSSLGRKGLDSGPTHVLVVRGLDENADEEMLHYEFSKHAPIKDLRLVRDKFTHVSRGFAFVHFHSVEDASKALQATNGTALEKNGQILRVAYAKSVLGAGTGTSGPSQSSSLAAAAIEAATFAQQYDAVGWAPKEYNPDDKQPAGGREHPGKDQQVGSAPQSGFLWDEASGYYYDAASGFYYDGNSGLYYDGNNGAWYSFDDQTQQYVPCNNRTDDKLAQKQGGGSKAITDGSNKKAAIICAPAATTTSVEKAASLPDAVQAAAAAALAAEKKEKEKLKEIRLASKSSILANKKKMNNVLSMWKQRSHEGQTQTPRVALEDSQVSKYKPDLGVDTKETGALTSVSIETMTPVNARPVNNSSGGTVMGVIRGSVKSDSVYSAPSGAGSADASLVSTGTPFRTDPSALGAYASPPVSGSARRRFSEKPMLPSGSATHNKEVSVSVSASASQTTYRDRAAERRSLYGSSSSLGNDPSDFGIDDSNRDLRIKKGCFDSMPFPPGVGGGDPNGDAQSFEVITTDKAIDEKNVGNRMLRNMGWQEGSGLGKDGRGLVEPVQAKSVESRAGLGSQKPKMEGQLKVQAGDSYKTVIHKKALARFRDMSS